MRKVIVIEHNIYYAKKLTLYQELYHSDIHGNAREVKYQITPTIPKTEKKSSFCLAP